MEYSQNEKSQGTEKVFSIIAVLLLIAIMDEKKELKNKCFLKSKH